MSTLSIDLAEFDQLRDKLKEKDFTIRQKEDEISKLYLSTLTN